MVFYFDPKDNKLNEITSGVFSRSKLSFPAPGTLDGTLPAILTPSCPVRTEPAEDFSAER